MIKNEYKTPIQSESEKKETKSRFSNSNNSIGKTLQTVVDGSFLTKKNVTNSLPFILYLAFIAIMYIANTYYAERIVREIETTKVELKELRSEYLSLKSKVMEGNRQSAVAHRVSASGIEEAVTPPFIIINNNMEE